MKKKIDSFRGEYAFLSNFYEHPFEYEGAVYPTSEHAFQAMKTKVPVEREFIRTASTTSAAKKLGRMCTLRKEWNASRGRYMRAVLWEKFRDPELRKKLLATGDAYLEEGNTWGDTYWGVCKGVGSNILGKLLMDIRDTIRKEIS